MQVFYIFIGVIVLTVWMAGVICAALFLLKKAGPIEFKLKYEDVTPVPEIPVQPITELDKQKAQEDTEAKMIEYTNALLYGALPDEKKDEVNDDE